MADSSNSRLAQTVFLNGEFLTAGDARLSISDQGVLFGFGFFESFRTSGGRPHWWKLHRRRLEEACAIAGLILPAGFLAHDDQRMTDAVRSMLERAGVPEAVFRYTITGGPVGGQPSEFLTMRALPPAAGGEGICLRVLNVARDNGEWLPRPKSLNYANAILGARELGRRTTNPGDEGLFLSRGDEYVVETPRQNVAWVRDGRIYFPDPSIGALAGTCLAWLLELDSGAQPCRARVDELLKADAIMVLNSVRGITAVREIRDKQDRVLVSSLASQVHPLVVSLRHQWDEALQATARG